MQTKRRLQIGMLFLAIVLTAALILPSTVFADNPGYAPYDNVGTPWKTTGWVTYTVYCTSTQSYSPAPPTFITGCDLFVYVFEPLGAYWYWHSVVHGEKVVYNSTSCSQTTSLKMPRTNPASAAYAYGYFVVEYPGGYWDSIGYNGPTKYW